MNVRIEDLTAYDFPGIDEAKFNEWKALRLRTNREYWIGACIFIALMVITSSFGAEFTMGVLVLFLVFARVNTFRTSRMGELGRELDMKRRLRAKRLGQEYKR
jgi:hypothetical protein